MSLERALTLTGNGVTTGALTSGDAVTVDAGSGALTVNGNVTAERALTLRGGDVTLGGQRASSGGAIDILARTGGIKSTGALALGSSSTRASDFVRLQANGAAGISLASGSSITGGSNKALRVAVFNGTAGAPLVLAT